MSLGRRVAQLFGILAGLALSAAAIWSVFFVDWHRERPAPEAVVRPLKTIVVGDRPASVRTFPARVRATTETTLAFQVPGILQTFTLTRGQRVAKGDVLGQLDRRDFQSRLDGAEVQLQQLTSEFAAITRAYDAQAATSIEVARFRSAVDRARAERDIAQKALEDTTLIAPFPGLVADVFVDQFQKVAPGTRVLRLQGGAAVRVEANVDAARVAFARLLNEAVTYAVRFDFLPGREFEAKLVEFTTEADRTTQTFLAILEMTAPEDAIILPGMTASIVERSIERTGVAGALAGGAAGKGTASGASDVVSVPIDTVAIDGVGHRYVWLVEDETGDTARVRRLDVSVGEALDDAVLITKGLSVGQRIAAAGVRELSEGQRVRPLKGPTGAPNETVAR